MANDPKQRPRLEIHKYPNRRYYDQTRSRHVRLEEIYELIRAGHEVRVTDSKTGGDLTAKVLAQIILAHDPPKLEAFPSELLHRLIRANEQLVNDFIGKYFNQALASFIDSQRQFEEYLRHAVGLSQGQATPGHLPFLTMPFPSPVPGFWASGQAQQQPGVHDAQPAPPGEVDHLRRTVDSLQRQIKDLQRALHKQQD